MIDANAMAFAFGRSPDKCAECCGHKPENISNLIGKIRQGSLWLAYNAHIKSEYDNTHNCEAFRLLWTALETSGKLKKIEPRNDERIKNGLRKRANLKLKDVKVALTALETDLKILISEDIDFWSPPDKNAQHKRKEQIKNSNRAGLTESVLKKLSVDLVIANLRKGLGAITT